MSGPGTNPVSAPPAVRTSAVTDHVVIVSVDGLRPDAIARFKAATIGRLAREGSYSLFATTINPSKTLPSHTSMLTGEGPEEHGITWNTNETDTHSHVAVPTIFALARERGLRTAAFFSKGKFNHLELPGSLDYTQAPNGNGRWSADRTVGDVERYLSSTRPNLLFVHVAEPDYAGHLWGWMSWMYGRAVRTADAAVARVVAAADRAFGTGNYTFLLTADHGGHGRSHGSNRPENVTIPWIAWGEGVRSGTELPRGIRTMDTAGTALWLLGIDAPDGWSGVPVREAFADPARVAADLATTSTRATVTSAKVGASGQ
jgi:predicted AlkP superfamily pyrophosphatase or phosphodiesterase